MTRFTRDMEKAYWMAYNDGLLGKRRGDLEHSFAPSFMITAYREGRVRCITNYETETADEKSAEIIPKYRI